MDQYRPSPGTTARTCNVARQGGQDRARVLWIDVAKGLSILLVVFLHAHVFLGARDLSSDVYLTLNRLFNPVRMPLFFFISGLLASAALAKGAGFVLRRKITYFAALFMLWSAVHISFFTYMPWHPFATYTEGLAGMWLQGLRRPETAIWFVWALAFYFAFALCLACRPWLAAGLALAGGVFGATNVMLSWGYNGPQQNLFTYLPFFVLPTLFARRLPDADIKGAVRLLVAGVMLAALSKAGLGVTQGGLPGGLLGLAKLAGGLGVGIGVSFLLSRSAAAGSVLSWLGRHTLAIYLLHPLVLGLGVAVFEQMPRAPVVAFGTAVATIVSLGLCLGLEALIRRSGAGWIFQPLRPDGVRLTFAGRLAPLRETVNERAPDRT